jgi:nitronate monooxygenase
MGSDEFSSLWAGQNARLAKSGTVDEIIQDLLGY